MNSCDGFVVDSFEAVEFVDVFEGGLVVLNKFIQSKKLLEPLILNRPLIHTCSRRKNMRHS
jgi:hypothetical protein